MSSETSMVAADFRLQEWAAQIRECQSRPAGMSVVGWCACHGITKANYYYRLRRVRAACLEKLPEQMREHLVVPVEPELLQKSEHDNRNPEPGLDISIKEASIHVTEHTPMPLLAAVLEVMRNA